MQRYGVFLRAVNVGGTGKLPMSDLREICAAVSARDVKTYIASGNAAFDSGLSAQEIKMTLEAALQKYASKPVAVFVRTHTELCEIKTQNPFPEAAGNQVTAILLDEDPQSAIAVGLKGQMDEIIRASERVIYVHYPSGMGRSKLKLLGAEHGTARNINTIAKMVQLTA